MMPTVDKLCIMWITLLIMCRVVDKAVNLLKISKFFLTESVLLCYTINMAICSLQILNA